MEAQSKQLQVGDKVKLTKDIYDHGADGAYPPGYIAYRNEIVIVREIRQERGPIVFVSHEHITDKAFYINKDEYKKVELE